MNPTPNDLDQIDAALRLLDREVWIITAADGPRGSGLVATWVSAASIDRERPMLVAGLAPNHFTTELVQVSRAFAAHLVRPDQVELAWNFASDSGRNRDKFANLAIERRETGSPILADCLAWFDCRVLARYDAGDRLFFWGDVVTGGFRRPISVRTLREQLFFNALTKERREQLIAARDADAVAYRPLQAKWRLTQ